MAGAGAYILGFTKRTIAIAAMGMSLGGFALGQTPASAQTSAPARSTTPASSDLLLGRFPVVTENGRKVAQVALKDVLALVLERNLSLRASQVTQDASREILKAAEGRLQTNFSSSLGYARTVTPSATAGAPAAAPPLTSFFTLLGSNATTLNAGLSQADWYGNMYSLNYLQIRSQSQNLAVINANDNTSHAGPNTPLNDVSFLTAAATIPFAQGSGYEFNRVPVGQAETGLRFSMITTRLNEQTALNTVAQAYWSLVGQLQIVAVIEQAVRLDEQLLQDNQTRVRAGTRVPSDVQATETQLALDRRNLLQARLVALQIEDQVRIALGIDMADFGFKPVDQPTAEPTLPAEAKESAPQLERVYANSPALATALANLENKTYDVLTARNANKVTLNAALSYTLMGYGNDAASAAGFYGRDDTTGNSASLSLTSPLFDKVGPATVQRRETEQRALELLVRDQRTSLAIQLQNTLRNLRLATEQVSTARAAVDLAQTQLNNEVKRLSLGASTPFTVAQLQQQLSQAQQQEIAARVQFEQNHMLLLVLTGDVYKQYGLTSLAGESGQ